MKKLWILLVLGLFVTAGCSGSKNQTTIDPIIDPMADQISIKAQDWDPLQPGKQMMLLPPENTVPRGVKVYNIEDPELAGRTLKNPWAEDRSSKTLEIGKKYYVIYCGVCHGDTGAGEGPVAGAMPLKPPSLVSGLVSTYTDGRYYHTIVKGRGVMGSYAGQIREEKQRWAVVNYIRSLQGK